MGRRGGLHRRDEAPSADSGGGVPGDSKCTTLDAVFFSLEPLLFPALKLDAAPFGCRGLVVDVVDHADLVYEMFVFTLNSTL